MGRAKIEIKRIANTANRQITFSKRRMGLFKKARELSVLCNAQVGLVIVSSTGRIYDFASPICLEHILDCYISSRGNSTNHEVLHEQLNSTSSSNSGLQVDITDGSMACMRNELEKLHTRIRLIDGDPEELKSLSVSELVQLESQIEKGLNNIREYKMKQPMRCCAQLSVDVAGADESLEYSDASDSSLDVELRLNTVLTPNSNGRSRIVF